MVVPGAAENAKRRNVKPLLEPIAVDGAAVEENGNSKFARALGSVDFLTRERGVQALTRFLQRKTDISEADMIKLWKGLYFCFWHSDKAPVQADLAERLAGILSSVSQQVAFLYFTVFIKTMQREWLSIDKLRLDKFLMLVRKFIAQAFTLMAKNSWDLHIVKEYTEFVQNAVLLPKEPQRAAGLAYHICDIYIPELKRTLAASVSQYGAESMQGKLTACSLQALLAPFITALQRAGDEPMINRVKDAVFESLVEEAQEELEQDTSESEEDEPAVARLPSLLVAFTPAELAAQLFELGALPEVRARNRAALYGVSQQLERTLKKRAKKEQKAKKAAAAVSQSVKPVQAGAGSLSQLLEARAAAQQQQQSMQLDTPLANGHDSQAGDTTGKKKKKRKAGQDQVVVETEKVSTVPNQQPSEPQPATNVSQIPTTQASTPAKLPAKQAKPAKSALKTSKVAITDGSQNASSANDTALQSKEPIGTPGKDITNQQGGRTLRPKNGVQSGQQQAGFVVKPTDVHVKFQGMEDGKDKATTAANRSAKKTNASASAKPIDTTPTTPTTQQQLNAEEAAEQLQAPPSTMKKNVRINTKKNLYFEFGGPVPDPLVRTPQTSRSKGGILKKSSSLTATKALKLKKQKQPKGSESAPAKLVTLRSQPISSTPVTVSMTSGGSPARQHSGLKATSVGRSPRVTPATAKRARAADLF